MNDPVRFNPLASAFLADPYPTYRQLRENDPVHWSPVGLWYLTRHDDIKAVLKDARFIADDIPERLRKRGELLAKSGGNLHHLNRFFQGMFLFSNSPQHNAWRNMARTAMTSLTLETVSRVCADVVAELLRDLHGPDPIDLVAHYTEPLASRTIGRLLGLTDDDSAAIQIACHRIGQVLDSTLPLEDYPAVNEVTQDMLARLDKTFARGSSDFMRRLAAAGQDLPADFVVPATASIFFAGQETSAHGLANGIYSLAQIDATKTAGKHHEALSANGVHELLRFESPFQCTSRIAAEDVELRGRKILCGQRVMLYLGAANRDPDVFPQPNVLDLNRDSRGHLVFGAGSHRCLGAHLGIEEMQIGLTALFRAFPVMTLCNPTPTWRKSVTLRGHAALTFIPNSGP